MKLRTSMVVIAILIAMALLLGCGSDEMEPTEPAPPAVAEPTEAATATPPPEPTPESVQESAEVEQPAESESSELDTAADGQSDEGPVTFKSDSLHGNMTASGEPFDKDSFTAAHKDLPFETEVTVINLFNGKQTTVRINDRLPPQVSAVIDISPAAAREIEMIDAGIVDGRIEW